MAKVKGKLIKDKLITIRTPPRGQTGNQSGTR